jgi:hypothetical protein
MKTGLTTNTEGRLVFGAGEVYLDFDEDYLTGTSVGATRGDAVLDFGRTFRNVEVAGVIGPIKGLVRRDNVAPTLKVQLLEITAANLAAVIAGATTDTDGNIIGGEITDSAYLDNVTLVAEGAGGEDFIVILYNALATSIQPVTSPDKGEMILEVTFTAHFDPATPDTEPWKIIPIPEGS